MEASRNPLSTNIQYLKGVGPKMAELLSKKGIATFEDALYFLPRTYQDRSKIKNIADLTPGESTTVQGVVTAASKSGGARFFRGKGRFQKRGGRQAFNVTLFDGTARIKLHWFNAYASLEKEFQKGKEYIVHGEVKSYGSGLQISHPDYECIAQAEEEFKEASTNESLAFGRVVPIYSETEGLHQKTIRKIIAGALDKSLTHLKDPLPEYLKEKLDLPDLKQSFKEIHYPTDCPDESRYSRGMKRIIFEEFFVLQLGLGIQKRKRQTHRSPILKDPNQKLLRFKDSLPFPMTGDQKEALKEIELDLQSGHPMTRLIQGDVGSGKTVVAFGAACMAASSGYQSALMVPTEVLAQQHLKNAREWLEPLGIKCELLAAGKKNKQEALDKAKSGEAHFFVGTHALFQKGVEFNNLGLIIFDEQHRFGVEQRQTLVRKGKVKYPHVLMMTATPIPRTLSLTLYGDLDLTLIKEKPAGRQPITTRVLFEKSRPKLYESLRKKMSEGEQAFIIYPLVEASEKLDLKSATQMHERLEKEVFPDFRVALLHGRMKAEEKETILKAFKNHEYDLLVSTTVIEVGIDVPNATIMVIEHPERLGLSQLHQLRGRVGRGDKPSFCILLAEFMTERLKVMSRTEDGFVIAEEDLKIRGPGEFLGTRQSGLPGFRVGHILRDANLLSLAQKEAQALLRSDPQLHNPEHRGIRELVEDRWKWKLERLRGT